MLKHGDFLDKSWSPSSKVGFDILKDPSISQFPHLPTDQFTKMTTCVRQGNDLFAAKRDSEVAPGLQGI
jgi:hypothetical protein